MDTLAATPPCASCNMPLRTSMKPTRAMALSAMDASGKVRKRYTDRLATIRYDWCRDPPDAHALTP